MRRRPGTLGVWNSTSEAPEGCLEERIQWLRTVYNLNQERSRARWAPVRFDVYKALVLDLVLHVHDEGGKVPEELRSILAELMGVSSKFGSFCLKRRRGKPSAHPTARFCAMWIHAGYIRRTGKPPKTAQLSREVGAALGLARPFSRASLDRWRKEPAYQEFVQRYPAVYEQTARKAGLRSLID